MSKHLTATGKTRAPFSRRDHGALPTAPTRQFDAFFLVPLPDEATARQLEAGLLQRVRDETVAQMQGRPMPDPLVPFERLAAVHFARLLILRDIEASPLLGFALDYDGVEGSPECPAELAHRALMAELEELPGLKQIFAYCSGYDSSRPLTPFLERHQLPAATPYVGTQGRSVRQIREEAALRRKADEVLRALKSPPEAPEQALAAVRAAIGSVVLPFPPQPDRSRQLYRSLAAFALPRLPLLGLAAPLRWLERRDPQFQSRLDAQVHHDRAAAAPDEDLFLQNELTHVVQIKDGPLRSTALRLVFGVLAPLSKYYFNRGELGGIPSIHFARWVVGPRGRLIFFSNYDGSWESYLGSFVEKASVGLTAVWSNTKLFPRSRWLTGEGSRDAPRFLAWTRAHQRRCHVWYSAYPELSVVEINRNTEIRRALAQPAGVDAPTWLSLMSNVDRFAVGARHADEQTRQPPVDESDVQGLVLRGYGNRSGAAYLLLQVSQDADKAALRTWLSELPVASAADARGQREDTELLNVAFTHTGLGALGLEPTLCNAFSTAFVQGSRHPQRLATTGDPDPEGNEPWLWGGRETDVHVALLVFAKSERMKRVVAKYSKAAEAAGLKLVRPPIHATPTGDEPREHFGFRDGIGQPRVQGVGRTPEGPDTIAPGEVLLGLHDGCGDRSPAPASGQGFRFGHNGSYMVLRQLEQRVEDFWTYCASEGARKGTSAIKVASQMVGRWPSGAPLVHYPDADPGSQDAHRHNEFSYLEPGSDNDRHGSRCPFGAHVRRANPRDWQLGETREESRKAANQHRISRRGRPYGAPLVDSMRAEDIHAAVMGATKTATSKRATDGRGMLFICFNADIERQFEFVQQNWCNSPKFAGQSSDADALLGQSTPARRARLPHGLTLQPAPGECPARFSHLGRFVETRGSAYFFMPSLTALRLLPHYAANPTGNSAAKYEHVPADEQQHIDRLAENIRRLIAHRDAGGLVQRDAHPKMHALVDVTLEVASNVPVELRHGLFACGGESFRGVVRLSNQDQNPKSDTKKDTRGLALKLLEAPGPRLLEGEELLGKEGRRHHDFIFLSAPTFVARDVAEFGQLIEFIVNGLSPQSLSNLLRGIRAVPRALPPMLRQSCVASAHGSLLEIPYFSVAPSMLGPRPVQYSLKPQQEASSPIATSRSHLREQLAEQLSGAGYSFDLMVQPYLDERRTPVEDPTRRWRSKPAKVATLHLPQQSAGVYDTQARRRLGEDISFNPFRCLPEHRPVGGINRARRQIYRQLAQYRHDRNNVDPADVRARLDALLD